MQQNSAEFDPKTTTFIVASVCMFAKNTEVHRLIFQAALVMSVRWGSGGVIVCHDWQQLVSRSSQSDDFYFLLQNSNKNSSTWK